MRCPTGMRATISSRLRFARSCSCVTATNGRRAADRRTAESESRPYDVSGHARREVILVDGELLPHDPVERQEAVFGADGCNLCFYGLGGRGGRRGKDAPMCLCTRFPVEVGDVQPEGVVGRVSRRPSSIYLQSSGGTIVSQCVLRTFQQTLTDLPMSFPRALSAPASMLPASVDATELSRIKGQMREKAFA